MAAKPRVNIRLLQASVKSRAYAADAVQCAYNCLECYEDKRCADCVEDFELIDGQCERQAKEESSTIFTYVFILCVACAAAIFCRIKCREQQPQAEDHFNDSPRTKLLETDQRQQLKTSYGDQFNPYNNSEPQKNYRVHAVPSRNSRDSLSKTVKSPMERELVPINNNPSSHQRPSPNPYYEMKALPDVQNFGSSLPYDEINPPGTNAGLFAMLPPPKDHQLSTRFPDMELSEEYRTDIEEGEEDRKKESFFRMNKKDKPAQIAPPMNESLSAQGAQNLLERMDSDGKLLTAVNSPAKEITQKSIFTGLLLNKAVDTSANTQPGASERLMAD